MAEKTKDGGPGGFGDTGHLGMRAPLYKVKVLDFAVSVDSRRHRTN